MSVKIIPLGGLEEIGKNCFFVENHKDILIIDCGLKFSNQIKFGAQFEIPDFKYLERNKKKIKGLFITHGHLDHIGAITYLLEKINTTIYGSKFTLELIKKKLTNSQLKKNKFIEYKEKSQLKIGDFKLEPFNVNHSIIESYGFILDLNIKGKSKIAHMGDFNMDPIPYKRKPTDLSLLNKYKKDILLLLSDSTNSPNTGNPVTEGMVYNGLESIFKDFKNKNKLIITTFSTQVSRILKILELSKKYNRKVFFSGRSIVDNFNILVQRPEYRSLKNQVINNKEVRGQRKFTIIASGTQGEKMASLFKMSEGTHNFIKIGPNDLIAFSSSVIPGNEKEVFTLYNNLAKQNIDFITAKDREIHATGHSVEKELQEVFDICKPDYFIPVHGESLHLAKHKKIGLKNNIKENNIFILENGAVINIDNGIIKIEEKINIRKNIISNQYKLIDEKIIEEREQMAIDGILFVQLTVKKELTVKSQSYGVFLDRHKKQNLNELNSFFINKVKKNNLKIDRKNYLKLQKIIESYFNQKQKSIPKIIISMD